MPRLEGIPLTYNGFAYKEWRPESGACNDTCILHRARAFLVDTSVTEEARKDVVMGEANDGEGIGSTGEGGVTTGRGRGLL